MTGQSHLLGGTIIGVSYIVCKNSTEGIPFLIGSMIGSIFPDIDSGQSKISRKLPVLSFLTRLFAGHRGMVHTPIFLIILGIVIKSICIVLQIPEHFLLGFIYGFICHLLQDTATRQGVKWLYPVINKSFRLFYFRSGRGMFSGVIEIAITILIVSVIVLPILLGGSFYE